jgi:hypothetical protein
MSEDERPAKRRSDQLPTGTHTCIFELERKGTVFTAEVICMVCGVYLSSQQDWPPGTREGRRGP